MSHTRSSIKIALSKTHHKHTLPSCRSITAESIPSSSSTTCGTPTSSSSSGSFTYFDGRPLFLAGATDAYSFALLRRLSLS